MSDRNRQGGQELSNVTSVQFVIDFSEIDEVSGDDLLFQSRERASDTMVYISTVPRGELAATATGRYVRGRAGRLTIGQNPIRSRARAD
jgi:hypothetical protein